MKRFLFHIVLLILPLFTVAQNKKVAVYVMGEDAGINKVLESKLVSAISRSEEFTAIERTTAFLAELRKEQNYQRTGAVDDNELSRLGKQFGVRYICVAAVSEAFNEKYLSARLIDVESAQVEYTASSSGAIQSLPTAMSAAETVSKELLSSLGKSRQYNSPKVAVYVVRNEAGKNIGRVLGDKLVAGFTNSGRYIAVERTNSFLQQLSKEQNYQRTGAVDDNDISRLGKQFGVQYVCVADISDVFGEKYITSRLINVETAEVVNSNDVGGVINNMGDCVRMANEIALNLSKGTFAEQAEEARKRTAEQTRIKAEQERMAAERRAQLKAEGYVDLGLPSGTLWRVPPKIHVHYTWDEAKSGGDEIPSQGQWEELIRYCKWIWNGSGYNVTGSNGNSIVLHANGGSDCDGKIHSILEVGFYWSSTTDGSDSAYVLAFDSNEAKWFLNHNRCARLSVCRVQKL